MSANSDDPNFDRLFKRQSSRHHYIPRFLIEGFTNSDGLLYIFDKVQNRILKKARPSKSIFFEENRNTIEVMGGKKSSIIEDYMYGSIDSKTSEVIKYYQNEPIERVAFDYDNEAMFLFFLINLFWRIPKTDFAANYTWSSAEIKSLGVSPEEIRNHSAFKKIGRAAGLVRHHIKEITGNAIPEKKKWVNIFEYPKDACVIGDYPILFRKQPYAFSEFNSGDILFALSSKRIYVSANSEMKGFSGYNALRYNAAIIEQSKRYVCSGNLELLQSSVAFYQALEERGLLFQLRERAFSI